MGIVDDKIVLVTGGGSGMGAAGAEIFAREGAAHVYVVDVNTDGGERVAAAVHKAGAGASFVAVDVTEEGAVAGLIDRIVAEHGRLDCAWNNAGITDAAGPFTSLAKDAWDRMIAVNLTAVFLCMKHELRQMTTQGYGAVVNTSSGAGIVAAPYLPHYTAAKHGVLGLTRAMALEVAAKGVTVNAVCPGYTETDIVASAIDNIVAKTGRTASEARAELAKANPQGRLIQPEEVADTVAWLCGSAGVNGQAIAVCGGETM